MDAQPLKHVCGVCLDEWLTEDEYNNHICPKTHAQPVMAEHLIKSTTPDFAAISEAAIARGADQTSDAAPITTPVEVAPQQPPINLN